MNIAILGASDKLDRYSYLCLKMLKEHGYNPIPIHPSLKKIEDIAVFSDLEKVAAAYPDIHTLTIYIRPELSTELLEQIITLSPERVIFNPGSENKGIYERIKAKGIRVEEACTLVLLQTGQFE